MSNSIQRDQLKQLCFTTFVVINMRSSHSLPIFSSSLCKFLPPPNFLFLSPNCFPLTQLFSSLPIVLSSSSIFLLLPIFSSPKFFLSPIFSFPNFFFSQIKFSFPHFFQIIFDFSKFIFLFPILIECHGNNYPHDDIHRARAWTQATTHCTN